MFGWSSLSSNSCGPMPLSFFEGGATPTIEDGLAPKERTRKQCKNSPVAVHRIPPSFFLFLCSYFVPTFLRLSFLSSESRNASYQAILLVTILILGFAALSTFFPLASRLLLLPLHSEFLRFCLSAFKCSGLTTQPGHSRAVCLRRPKKTEQDLLTPIFSIGFQRPGCWTFATEGIMSLIDPGGLIRKSAVCNSALWSSAYALAFMASRLLRAFLPDEDPRAIVLVKHSTFRFRPFAFRARPTSFQLRIRLTDSRLIPRRPIQFSHSTT